MRIKRRALKTGYVLDEDVYGKTNHPIIRKDTVLTDQHLQVLEAFFIEEVLIAQKNADSGEADVKKEDTEKPHSSFIEHYLSTVQAYKQLFNHWQNGERVNVFEVRRSLVPFLEEAVEQPVEIFSLHQYMIQKDYLFHHAVSTAAFSAFLAKQLRFSRGDWIQIGLAGALSDCGLSKISTAFLKKKETLSFKEREEIRQHPVYGYQMLRTIPVLKEGVCLAVSQHHEREDGSGYPLGISGDQIHPFSKIVAVADSFHAMACDRPHRAKKSPFQAIEVMMEKQFGCFQLSAVKALSDALVRFSVGTKVRLTDDRLGEIIFIPPQQPTRPIIRLAGSGEIVALGKQTDLSVDTILT